MAEKRYDVLAMGELLIDFTENAVSGQGNTLLAFVHTAPDGDRDFSFYRNPGADMMLTAAEVREDLIAASRLFHFGTLSMTQICVRPSGRTWRRQRSRCCLRWGSVTF